MTAAFPIVLVALGAVVFLALSGFAVISFFEGERRAMWVAFALAVVGGAVFIVAAFLPSPVPEIVLVAVGAAGLISVIAWFLAIGRDVVPGGRPSRRVDERTIPFAWYRLVPGSENYQNYYRMHPERKKGDDRTRSLPGLLSPNSEMADRVLFAAADAAFDLCEALHPEVDGEPAAERVELTPEIWVDRLKTMARANGAVSVGVTQLEPYHYYSHVGRGAGRWGAPISPEHRWAIAFTVEMDHEAVSRAPAAATVVESAHQYVEAAKIAVQMAMTLRKCGWPARAHIDGNYRVIAPLVARDAGLGELGRMGLLMTPDLGPRVRLGVVTTDVPLIADRPGDDTAVLDFCTICRKCADNCPVGAIPSGDRLPIDEGLRWGIDHDTCFRYWNTIGTDCGRCLAVCPYSHPNNAAHNIVRWAIARSGAARRAMLRMDDVFYGRKPRPKA